MAGFNVGGIQALSLGFSFHTTDMYFLPTNLDFTVKISGTVGAATEAAKEKVPTIAFSGTTGSQTGYTAPVENYVRV